MRQISILVLLLFYSSCKKESLNSISEGIYKGTFQRQTPTGGQIADVTLNFSRNTFNGQATVPRYPVICKGSYILKSGKIYFQDSCFYTADFDWTLILSQEYQIKHQGNTVEIWRDYNTGAKDIYKLTKQ